MQPVHGREGRMVMLGKLVMEDEVDEEEVMMMESDLWWNDGL